MIMVIANILTARSARPPGAGQIRRRQADGRLARPPGQAQPGSRRRRGGAGERDRPRRPSRARGVRTAVPPQRLRDTLFVRYEDGNTQGAHVGDALMGKRSSAEGEAKSSASLMRLCLLAPRTGWDGDGREGVNRHRTVGRCVPGARHPRRSGTARDVPAHQVTFAKPTRRRVSSSHVRVQGLRRPRGRGDDRHHYGQHEAARHPTLASETKIGGRRRWLGCRRLFDGHLAWHLLRHILVRIERLNRLFRRRSWYLPSHERPQHVPTMRQGPTKERCSRAARAVNCG